MGRSDSLICTYNANYEGAANINANSGMAAAQKKCIA